MEHWKPVLNCESLYEVSSLGRVRSLARIDAGGNQRREKFLKPHETADGYIKVCFFRDKRFWHPTVHRVVFEAFHGPIPDGHEINHKNGMRSDNRPENLESLPHSDNVRYSKEVLKANYATFGNAKLDAEKVRTIKQLIAQGHIGQREIGAMFGVGASTIGNIKTGHSWGHV